MNGLESKNDLSTRQWALYNCLKEIYENDENKYINLKDLYWELREHYPFLSPNVDWNNQQARRQLTEDINALKNSKRLQKIILSNNKGVKIANESEVDELVKEGKSVLHHLSTISFQLKKVGLDGQLRIPFGSERDVIETFAKKGVEA